MRWRRTAFVLLLSLGLMGQSPRPFHPLYPPAPINLRDSAASTPQLRLLNHSSGVFFPVVPQGSHLGIAIDGVGQVARFHALGLAIHAVLFMHASSGQYVGFQAHSASTGSVVWQLPAADGTAGTFLSTRGAGVLEWTSATAGITGTGANTRVAFWSGTSSLSSSASLTWDGTLLSVLSTAHVSGAFHAGGTLHLGGSLLLPEDNRFDLGKSNGDRFRDLYASRNIVGSGDLHVAGTLHLGATGARVFHTATQTVTAADDHLTITFNSRRWLGNGVSHSTSANSGRLTITTPGYWLVFGHVRWGGGSSGSTRNLYIRLNNTTFLAGQSTEESTAGYSTASTIWYFNANDYVELVANSDFSSRTILADGAYSPEFGVWFLGG